MTREPMLTSERVLVYLALVPFLRAHGPTSLVELSERFAVSERELRSMIEFLGTAGIPGETLAYLHDDLFDIDWDALETGVVDLTHTVAIEETPRFSGVELSVMLAGLRALEPHLDRPDRERARALRTRLAAAVGRNPHHDSVSAHESVADAWIDGITRAITERRMVQFDYAASEGASRLRTLEPWILEEIDATWFVTGWSRERQRKRSFRIDRMSSLRIGAAAVRPRPTSGLGLLEHAAEHEQPRIQARVPEHLLPRFRSFAPRIVGFPAPSGGPRTVVFEIDAWHAASAVRLVQQAPGEVEVLSPPGAREAVRQWAERALGGYGRTP